MKITHKANPEDPVHPIMHGDSPIAKEFNRRQEEMWKKGAFGKFDFEQVVTVLLEIFAEDYNKKHAPKKIKNKKQT